VLDLDRAAAGEALDVLEEGAGGGDRPGVDANVGRVGDLCFPWLFAVSCSYCSVSGDAFFYLQ